MPARSGSSWRLRIPIIGSASTRIWPGDMELTGIDQLWVADITYIRLEDGVRLPGGGARCIFAPRDRLGAGPDAGGDLAVAALQMALQQRAAQPG